MRELLRLAEEVSTKNPEVKKDVDELVENCFNNIKYNAAEQYEVEKCYESIKQLKNKPVVSLKKPKRFKK